MQWKNWAENVSANPNELIVANNDSQLIDAITLAQKKNLKIRPVGTGHSFTPLCATDGILVSLADSSDCYLSNNGIASFWAGSKIGTAAEALWQQGGSFKNQGDIDVQSLAGALGTGTHGTGDALGSFSEMTTAVSLITADAQIQKIGVDKEPELLRAAALSVGMLGLVSKVKLQVAPRYYLKEEARIMEVDACFENFDEFNQSHRNVEFYWLPAFDKCVAKHMDPISVDDIIEEEDSELAPPGTIERYLRPTRANKAHLVYRNIRTVPFLEMEYSVPIEAGISVLREIRHLMQTDFPEKTWVVEYRTQAEDDLLLSPAFGRTVAAISVHDQPGQPRSEEYFRACEHIFIAHDGRPHWGKLCFLSASQRAGLFPGFESFSRIRQNLDPDGVFLNDYLRPLFR